MADSAADQKLQELKHREEEELASILSQKYGAQYIDISRVTINSDALRLIAEKQARETEVAAFDLTGKTISLAMRSPIGKGALEVKEELTKRGFEIKEFMVSHASLESAWARYRDLSFATETKEGVIDISSDDLTKLISEIHAL